jgi:hypothetical protein
MGLIGVVMNDYQRFVDGFAFNEINRLMKAQLGE